MLLGEFAEEADDLKDRGVKFAFGGTLPVVERTKYKKARRKIK